MDNIRNFCIIAHIDHGKSTLADRLLEYTGAISKRDMQDQVLDDMDLEREKGITIKSHAIQMRFRPDSTRWNSVNTEVYTGTASAICHGDCATAAVAGSSKEYILNLIDTPGHVDFSYEVSRSIAACEGALLLIDASQGVQAQTMSNLYLALDHGLTIIPVLNKIDLPGAMIDECKEQIKDLLCCDYDDIMLTSAKTGVGVEEILHAIVERIPPPDGDKNQPLQAMVFDSVFNPFKGVEVYFRVFNGTIHRGDRVRFMNTNMEYDVNELGILQLHQTECDVLEAGNVGYIVSGIKCAVDVKVGDTITHVKNPCHEVIRGFEDVKPMVFAGIYPINSEEYDTLKVAIEKLQLNDASLVWTYESSVALGLGFRCGFLGMLHMEIVQERLRREFNIEVINTAPSVEFKIINQKGIETIITSPKEFPDPGTISRVEEPIIRAQIITRPDYIGDIISLCTDKRGVIVSQNYMSQDRVEMIFRMPLVEIVFDFFDKLKTISHGYASLDYDLDGFEISDLVKLDVLLNGERVDALSVIVHRSKAYDFGHRLCSKLKELIHRQLFEVPIQASIGNRVIARETVKAMRKDVIAKCYGGDISRKRKLLEKQKEGKKKMKRIGSVEIPQEAFLAILKV